MGILIATAVLCVVQYGIEAYQKPVKTEVSYETTGCVIWDENYEIIPVEIKGTRYSYLWKNEDDYFLGTLYSEGKRIISVKVQPYGGELYLLLGEKVGATAKIGQEFMCSSRENPDSFYFCASRAVLNPHWERISVQEEGTVLLVVPARSLEEAGTVMSEYWEKDGEEPMLEGFWQMF